ncbi:hypothetical protein [Sulfuricurvum sp.]|uniref:hypothetical protein n=1 Tax=Sulfuricurvum sp. TaxID=2025608 RepID=UPI0035639499
MKPKSLIFTLYVMVALIVLAGIGAREHSLAQELNEEHTLLLQQVKSIDLLKRRWSIQESQRDFEYLKNHPNLIKQEKRGGNVYFEYDNLSSSEFNILTNKLLNSMLVIKKLTLQRNGASKGYITVEIES